MLNFVHLNLLQKGIIVAKPISAQLCRSIPPFQCWGKTPQRLYITCSANEDCIRHARVKPHFYARLIWKHVHVYETELGQQRDFLLRPALCALVFAIDVCFVGTLVRNWTSASHICTDFHTQKSVTAVTMFSERVMGFKNNVLTIRWFIVSLFLWPAFLDQHLVKAQSGKSINSIASFFVVAYHSRYCLTAFTPKTSLNLNMICVSEVHRF